MPYADPEKQRAAINAAQRRRYAEDAEFRERKLEARQTHRKTEEGIKSNRAAVKKWRENHPEEYRVYNRERMRKARARKKAAALAAAAATAEGAKGAGTTKTAKKQQPAKKVAAKKAPTKKQAAKRVKG
ncbi:hypothetical protein [Verrucomicrobium spinosum]|uniref:hypothetical protein n=1 Tax=Verrucomicrobium spinosum TaxID=2736 RepID=UPI00017465BD|nr:hypothetical protein [Verrucomicrobium spinosum]